MDFLTTQAQTLFVGLGSSSSQVSIFYICCQAEAVELEHSLLDKVQFACLQPYFKIVVPNNKIKLKKKKEKKKKRVVSNRY